MNLEIETDKMIRGTYLCTKMSAACKIGYRNRPVRISFTSADFSLNCGRFVNRGIVHKQPSIQHSSAGCGIVDCRKIGDFFSSMPQAKRVAVNS